MTKQISILVVSLFLLIFSGLWEIHYLDTTSKYLISDIDYMKNALEGEHLDMAKEHIDEMQTTWKNMKMVWNIFVNHERMDDLEEAMVELKAYVEEGDKEEGIKSAQKLKRIVEQIVDKQRFALEHVL